MDSSVDTLYIPEGANLGDPLPGDFILTHGSTWQAALIRFGQAMRFRGEDGKFTYWNHAALITGEDGEIVEALSGGIKRRNLSDYQPKDYVVVRLNDVSDEDRRQIRRFAYETLGIRYGWSKIISLAFSLLTGLKFNFGIDGSLICSGLVATALFKGPDNFHRSLDHMTPADLAKHYRVEGRGD